MVAISEALQATLARNVALALILGALLARQWGGLARWPMFSLLMLWPSFGGHWVDVWFLNWLRPRLAGSRPVQLVARLVVWFVGGVVLAFGAYVTAIAIEFRPPRWPAWWLGGLGFTGIELVAHLALLVRGRPSFYDGRG